MRISDIQYYLKVVELGSISRAAESLFISQQGLSRVIRNLEQELGVTLFQRQTNSIQLTEIGQQVARDMQVLMADYDAMMASLHSRLAFSGAMEEYTIYVTTVISITLLPKVFFQLHQRFPGIRFKVMEMLPLELIEQVELDEHSIGIISISDFLLKDAARLLGSDILFVPEFQDQLMLSVRQDSPLAKKDVVTIAELAQTPIALYNTEIMMLEHLLGQDASSVAVQTKNNELCRSMVEKGVAAGLTSSILEYYSAQGNTTMLPLEQTVNISYGCIYPANVPRSPITTAILEMVSAELAACKKRQLESRI